MRHLKKKVHLSRNSAARKALLKNLAKSLIIHKSIITTVAKAKTLRSFVAPIITKAKTDSISARREVFSHFQDKEPVKILFNEIIHKIADRKGGYTRIIRLSGNEENRALIELVDYSQYTSPSKRERTSENPA